MQRLLGELWNDDVGAILAVEWVFLVTILVIGLVVGLKAVQGSIITELEEIADAIGALSQTYQFGGSEHCCSVDPITGLRDCCAHVGGSSFTDRTNAFPVDTCVEGTDPAGALCPD